MKLEKCEMPKRRLEKNLQAFIEEFVKMETYCAKVVFNDREYKDIKVAYAAFVSAIARSGHTNIKARTLKGELYLVNYLIEEE